MQPREMTNREERFRNVKNKMRSPADDRANSRRRYKRQGEGVTLKEKYFIIFQNCWKAPALDPGREAIVRKINKQRPQAGAVR